MRSGIILGAIILSGIICLVFPHSPVSARNITVTATCNVRVTFTATIPDSVEQGKSFTITNITISPSSSYGFTVSSSTYDLVATNTSSTTYHQSFARTVPSPTTGHSSYVGHYPNWTLDATGPVGSEVTVTIKKSVTVVQGYGTVNCNFNKKFLSVPIVAPKSSPPPSSSPSPPPSSRPPSGPGPTKPSSTPKSNQKPSDKSPTTKTPKKDDDTPKPTDGDDTPSPSVDDSVTVIPLNVDVVDSSGKRVQGAVVTLDGSKELTTDNVGRVTFSNVLTGSHAILVTYKDQKVNQSIKLTADNVGEVITIELPAQSMMPALMTAGGATAALAASGAAGFLIIRRRRAAADQGAVPAISISSIVDGSAVPTPTNTTMAHIPAVPAFEPQPAAPAPAPWTPIDTVPLPSQTPPAPEAVMTPPQQVEPLPATQTTTSTPAQQAEPTPVTAETLPVESISTVPAADPVPASTPPLSATTNPSEQSVAPITAHGATETSSLPPAPTFVQPQQLAAPTAPIESTAPTQPLQTMPTITKF